MIWVDTSHCQIDIVETFLEEVLIFLIGNVPLDFSTELVQISLFIVQNVHYLYFEQLKLLQLNNQRIACSLKRLFVVHSLFHKLVDFLV